MLFAAEIALLSLMLFFISYPLFNRQKSGAMAGELLESDLSDLLYKKESSYIALKDLEFDFRTGKIDDDDYASMKSQLEAEALFALKMIDDHNKGATVSQAPSLSKDNGKAGKRFCHSCGKATMAGHKFCSSCGSPL